MNWKDKRSQRSLFPWLLKGLVELGRQQESPKRKKRVTGILLPQWDLTHLPHGDKGEKAAPGRASCYLGAVQKLHMKKCST